MTWRDARASATGDIDPERELELRLVAQAHAGAAWALSSLVARYQPPVVRYLIRLTGDQERAHALAEQVFVRMARRLRGPQRGEQLRLWLLRAATEAGLDALRRPASKGPAQLAAPRRAPALLPGQVREGAMGRVLHALGGRYRPRHVPRPVPPTQEFVWGDAPAPQNGRTQAAAETLSPREQVRHRLIRAVLAELTYSEAQCLALHLVAGLNQTEVALALGIAAPVARRRIVQGLQLFGRRYEATLASLGLPQDFADAEAANVHFTEAGAVIARARVPDETGAGSAASDTEEALRREREVTGTLVVPDRALPALEEFFAAETASQAPDAGAPLEARTAPPASPMPGPLDPLAAAAVFIPQREPAAAGTSLDEGTAETPEPMLAASHSGPEQEPAAPELVASGDGPLPAHSERPEQDTVESTGVAGRPVMPSESRAINEGTAQPERAAITARIVPVLAAGPDTQRAATPTRPLVATGDVTDTVTALGSAGDAAPSGPAVPASDEDEPDVLIEWGSNPQIPVHVRSDLNALLTPTDAATLSGQHDESDWLLVLDDERDGVPGASLETRRRRVLSADGEAEDPDESLW